MTEDPTQHGTESRETGSEALQESWKLAEEANKKDKPKGWSWIPIEAVSLHPEVLPREYGEDASVVAHYADVIDRLPPIKVQKQSLILIGGLNRIRAHERAARRLIKAVQIDVPDEEMWEAAFLDNDANAFPMTMEDRKRAAVRYAKAHPDVSQEDVASFAGISQPTVSRLLNPPTQTPPRGETDSRVRIQRDPLPTPEERAYVPVPAAPGPPPGLPPLPGENALDRTGGQPISLGAMFDMVLNQTPVAIARELPPEKLRDSIGQARQAARWFVDFAEALSDRLAETEMAGVRV